MNFWKIMKMQNIMEEYVVSCTLYNNKTTNYLL